MRERLNDRDSRRLLVGVLATLFGGIFWGFSGTSASYLFAHYQIDTIWLLSIRQLLAGAMFMVVILLFDRVRFVQLLKNRATWRSWQCSPCSVCLATRFPICLRFA